MLKPIRVIFSFVLILSLLFSLGTVVFAQGPPPPATEIEGPVELEIFTNSAYVLDGPTVYDNRDPVIPNTYTSEYLPGASAIYAKNGANADFKNAQIFGNGYMRPEDMPKELASKYGYASAVLVYQEGTQVVLKNPTIITSPGSYANGGVATFGGKLIIHGGTIDTDNEMGHGLDATYGGQIFAYGTIIHTRDLHAGALATDFGGGYLTVYNLNATTDQPTSPGIYTAGNSIITAHNSTFTSNACEAVMAAHDNGYTNLYNCVVTGTVGLNGHNSMGPDYSYIFMRGGTLNSTSGALVTEEGGKTNMTLKDVKVGTIGNGNLIEPQSGRLIVNLINMKAAGDIVRIPKSYLEVSLNNVKLDAAVSATNFSMDAASKWNVTGESSIVNINIAKEKKVFADEEATIYFNTLTIGGQNITGDYTVGNVHFVFSDTLVNDYEEPGPPGPPPGP